MEEMFKNKFCDGPSTVIYNCFKANGAIRSIIKVIEILLFAITMETIKTEQKLCENLNNSAGSSPVWRKMINVREELQLLV